MTRKLARSQTRNLNISHAHLRRDYHSRELSEKNIHKSPMKQFGSWFEAAAKEKAQDVNAFVLATADLKRRPAARIVLMKGYSPQGITFFTSYGSAKGKQIKINPYAEAVFYWGSLNRQVRLGGKIQKISRQESLRYFRSRPYEAQLAASISLQSRFIASRGELEKKYQKLEKELQGRLPDMPQDWGGYLLKVQTAEFWQGRPSRMHDRFLYTKKRSGGWRIIRLQP